MAHASHCVLDSSDHNRPVVGYVNICPSVIQSVIVYVLIVEMYYKIVTEFCIWVQKPEMG